MKEKIIEMLKRGVQFDADVEGYYFELSMLDKIADEILELFQVEKCHRCGADKTACQYICLECEWTYPDSGA